QSSVSFGVRSKSLHRVPIQGARAVFDPYQSTIPTRIATHSHRRSTVCFSIQFKPAK
ncbi:Uncharacterized protein DAT39_014859, partial [Clarias magur]